MNFFIPEYIHHILKKLEQSGFEAYIVGGCVRDMLMNKIPDDYDICTRAKPGEVMSLFPGSLPTGIKHGTVTVRAGKDKAEVTTFRNDGSYSDGRHPDSVSFLETIDGDLSRRDFTINAIACDRHGKILDPFGGRDDIASGVIRCVGEPEKRFHEDALRMLRAIRFSAKTGFTIEEKTLKAISTLAPLTSVLSHERVRDELEKTLLSPRPEYTEQIFSLHLLDGYIYDYVNFFAEKLKPTESAPLVRWSALCALLLHSGVIKSPEDFLKSLKLDSKTIKTASQSAHFAAAGNTSNPIDWKRFIAQNKKEAALSAASCMDMLYEPGHSRLVKSLLSSGECMTLSELAINGNDLMSLGFKGAEIGKALNALLNHVIDFPNDNTSKKLLILAKKLKSN